MTELTLQQYVKTWAAEYTLKVQNLKLFQIENTKSWNQKQIHNFILQLYHFRGHFFKMLWFAGSLAPNLEYKKIILENIGEEFGGRSTSHEQLYFRFTREFNIDINEEILNPKYNLAYLQNYNHNHLDYFLNKPWENVWSAFCAFEALDNIDYSNTYETAKSFGTSKSGLGFFRIHMVAQHFEHASKLLQEIWDKDQNAVKVAFEFIAENQLQMFKELDQQINSLRSSISQESNIN